MKFNRSNIKVFLFFILTDSFLQKTKSSEMLMDKGLQETDIFRSMYYIFRNQITKSIKKSPVIDQALIYEWVSKYREINFPSQY